MPSTRQRVLDIYFVFVCLPRFAQIRTILRRRKTATSESGVPICKCHHLRFENKCIVYRLSVPAPEESYAYDKRVTKWFWLVPTWNSDAVALSMSRKIKKILHTHTQIHTHIQRHTHSHLHTTLIQPMLCQRWAETPELHGRISTSELDPQS